MNVFESCYETNAVRIAAAYPDFIIDIELNRLINKLIPVSRTHSNISSPGKPLLYYSFVAIPGSMKQNPMCINHACVFLNTIQHSLCDVVISSSIIHSVTIDR